MANLRCVAVCSVGYFIDSYFMYRLAMDPYDSSYNKLLSLLGGALFYHLVIPGKATKTVWYEYWYGAEYEERCVDILVNYGTAPNSPNEYQYGPSIQ